MVDFQSVKNYLPFVSQPAVLQEDGMPVADVGKNLIRTGVSLADSRRSPRFADMRKTAIRLPPRSASSLPHTRKSVRLSLGWPSM